MPNEHKKRGRRARDKDKLSRRSPTPPPVPQQPAPTLDDIPIKSSSAAEWPLLDPDTKAYFIQINNRIVELTALHSKHVSDEEADDRPLLLRSALEQLAGHEIALATDPDTSVILETLLHSMDDFAKRVLADRFASNYAALSKHQFASHVLQTLISLGASTVDRECRGFTKAASSLEDNQPSEAASLPTMSSILLQASTEIIGDLSSLVTDAYGSHIVRTVIQLLSADPLLISNVNATRSKKSAKWRAHQQPIKSFVTTDTTEAILSLDKGKSTEQQQIPKDFEQAFTTILSELDTIMQGTKIKEYALHETATHVVQLVLTTCHRLSIPNAFLDRIMDNLPSSFAANPSLSIPSRSDYIETLLRSSVASHVLEISLSIIPEPLFHLLWKTYFMGRIHRLASHPVANFVLAKAVQRTDATELKGVIDEIRVNVADLIENTKTGTLRAALDRSKQLGCCMEDITSLLETAFQTKSAENTQYLILCGLSLMRLEMLRKNPSFTDPTTLPEITTQGLILLQSWLSLPTPHNASITTSLLSLPTPRILALASHPVASHLLDTFLTAPSIHPSTRRKFLLSLLGSYHILATSKQGSYIADHCWSVAEPYLKDKIVYSITSGGHEDALKADFYGRFWVRKLEIVEWKRRRDQWKVGMAAQTKVVQSEEILGKLKGLGYKEAEGKVVEKKKKKEKRKQERDEIDVLFEDVEKKKKKV